MKQLQRNIKKWKCTISTFFPLLIQPALGMKDVRFSGGVGGGSISNALKLSKGTVCNNLAIKTACRKRCL